MALDPDEVVNKRFSATKFRQGYDEEEVDEFLDEVVGELRRLNSEIDELHGKLSACEGRVGELSASGSRPEPDREPASSPAPVIAPAPAAAAAARPVAAAKNGAEAAAGMLALAQRLHDEHIEAAKTTSAKLISDAQERAGRIVRAAEEKQHETLSNLDGERQALERKVEGLRSFEREYRSRLRAYLENQLRDLESPSVAAARPEAGHDPSRSPDHTADSSSAPQGAFSDSGAPHPSTEV